MLLDWKYFGASNTPAVEWETQRPAMTAYKEGAFAMETVGVCNPVKVFVHLAAGHDASEWNRRWREHTLIGINDPSPYGYARANKMGCEVRFSKGDAENLFARTIRLGLRAVLGFDFLHARRNADEILKADIVWTHTESQFLAVSALLRFAKLPRGRRPKVIGQAVWLIDKWYQFSFLHRIIYRQLMRDIDVLTLHSPENARIARHLFPVTRIEVVLFGIPNETHAPFSAKPGTPIRVLCLGNDRDRDWDLAVQALAGQPGIELTIVSANARPRIDPHTHNVRVIKVTTNAELRQLFAESTLMLIPLKPNTHASGATVLQEAALLGLPIIATDTGGLRAYFDDDAVVYLPPLDAASITAAVRRVGGQPKLMERLASAAQTRATSGEIGCGAYIRRHVDLTFELLKTKNGL